MTEAVSSVVIDLDGTICEHKRAGQGYDDVAPKPEEDFARRGNDVEQFVAETGSTVFEIVAVPGRRLLCDTGEQCARTERNGKETTEPYVTRLHGRTDIRSGVDFPA